MLTTEQAFDALPYVAEIYEKLELQKFYEEQRKKNKDAPNEQLAQAVIMHIVKNSQKCRDSFFPLIAVLTGLTEEEARKQPVKDTVAVLRELFKDENWGFFKEVAPGD